MELIKVNKKTQLQAFSFRPTGDRETSDIHFLAANTVPIMPIKTQMFIKMFINKKELQNLFL